MEKGTPIDLKDIKPGYMVRAEWQRGGILLTATGTVREVRLDEGYLAFSREDGHPGLVSHTYSTYYLLSRPEKVVDKEDLKLGQRVRVEMKDGCTYEGEVVSMFLNRPSRNRLVNLDGTPSGRNGSTCVIESITKVVLLS